MRPSPTQTIHALLGAPPVAHPEPTGPVEAPYGCRICGGPCTRGLAYDDWSGAYSARPNRTRAWQSEVVCEACVAITARHSPCPARPTAEGKEPIRWGNVSVLYDDNGLITATKGEKPVIREWIARPRKGPWFAAFAESGQKHVLPWTRWCAAGSRIGIVRFEERDAHVSLDALDLMCREMCSLLTAGATKETMETGQYSPAQWRLCPEAIELFESRWSDKRGGDLFVLALWLAQRDEVEVAARIERQKVDAAAKKAAEKESKGGKRRKEPGRAEAAAGGVAALAASGVPRSGSECSDSLGAPANPPAGRSEDVRDDRRVDHADPPQAPAHRPQQGQLSLFGGALLGGAGSGLEGHGSAAPRGAKDRADHRGGARRGRGTQGKEG